MQLGTRLTTIHGVLTFQQSKQLKPYIDFNTYKIKKFGYSYKKDLMNNSVYAKAIETLRKRAKLRLVTNAKEYRNQPNCVSKYI